MWHDNCFPRLDLLCMQPCAHEPRAPLKALDDVVLASSKQPLVHLGGKSIVDEHVWARLIRPEGPHRARRQDIPVVLGPEELAQAPLLPINADRLSGHVDIGGQGEMCA